MASETQKEPENVLSVFKNNAAYEAFCTASKKLLSVYPSDAGENYLANLEEWMEQYGKDEAKSKRNDLGPIAELLKNPKNEEAFRFDALHLLCNYPDVKGRAYTKWLHNWMQGWMKKKGGTVPTIDYKHVAISDPTNYDAVYKVSQDFVETASQGHSHIHRSYHLSPGTPTMAAVWIILSKTKSGGKEVYPATLVASSHGKGGRVVSLPTEISAGYTPITLTSPNDMGVRNPSKKEVAEKAEVFKKILSNSTEMKTFFVQAEQYAGKNEPLLITGESGCGKELAATAIHEIWVEKTKVKEKKIRGGKNPYPFKAINCGAINKELIESTLFGTVSGAFTGATNKPGVFEQANGGTLFLDEIGEIPLESQVKFLRVLQEKKVTRLGSTESVDINARVIAATNRDLATEVHKRCFRLDLLFRIAALELKIPALRNRTNDIEYLAKEFLTRMDDGNTSFSTEAIKVLTDYPWPGNVRELEFTIMRAYSEAENENRQQIEVRDIKAALLGNAKLAKLINAPEENDLEKSNATLAETTALLAKTRGDIVQTIAMIAKTNSLLAELAIPHTQQNASPVAAGITTGTTSFVPAPVERATDGEPDIATNASLETEEHSQPLISYTYQAFGQNIDTILAEVERAYIQEALKREKNKKEAAIKLGYSCYKTFVNRKKSLEKKLNKEGRQK